ncbi:uncharacterized protein EAE97_008064 [Botrytis byssoidea]|uniref:Quinate transporter n=1 Tax=Botrytis byssoidea TaxID=139641 RepID=A0A9P5LVD5_9HELO|nr:uncharacterized protein EAE97_008064 [Botrytis byssoidea]KAF7936698.1 hypothetical protein EAE97_008064 [Botrytis byssoidea]
MGILTMVEDRPTPKSVYNWRVYVSAMTASFAACMIGYTTSFIGTTVNLDSFKAEFGLDKLSDSGASLIQANIVSLFQAGAFFGSIFAYGTAYYAGRRITLWTFVSVFILGVCITFASIGGHIGPMYAGRVISGFGVGGCTMIVPIYISEIAPPAIRGRLVGTYELGWQIGGLVGFWINFGMSQSVPYGRNQWLIPFAVQLIPAGIVLIGSLICLKETPRWLWTRGRREQGVENLCYIRQLKPDDTYILEEIEMMDLQINDLPTGFIKPLRMAFSDDKLLWRLFLGHMLFVLQNFAGINAINYYSPTIFKTMGVTSTETVELMTGLFGVVKCIMTVLWLTILIDKLGRRTLFISGGIVGAILMFIIGALIATAKDNTGEGLDSQGIATIFMIYLWTCIYITSWNGTPWVVNAEMFSQATRNVGQVGASMANWLWTFVIARVTPNMVASMGKNGFGMYFFFGSITALAVVFTWFLIPETKSVPLDRMDDLFAARPVRAAQKIVMEDLARNTLEFSKIDRKEESSLAQIERAKEAEDASQSERQSD